MSTGSANTSKASGAALATDPARWFVAVGDKPEGPFNDVALLQRLREGGLAPEQRVINKSIGMTGWEPSGQVPHIEGLRGQVESERRAVPRWSLAAGDKANGPFSDDDLQSMLQDGSLQDSSMVWRKGTTAWTKIADVRELDALRTRAEQAALPPIPVEGDTMPALPTPARAAPEIQPPIKVSTPSQAERPSVARQNPPPAQPLTAAAPVIAAPLVRLETELSGLKVTPAVSAKAVVRRLSQLRKVPDPILLHNDIQKVVRHLKRAEAQGVPVATLTRTVGILREFRDEVAPAAQRFNREEGLAARCSQLLRGSRTAAPRTISLGSARL